VVDVLLSPTAQRQRCRPPKTIRARPYALVQTFRQWPVVSGAKPLRGKLAGHYRIRTGDYRLQFHVEDDEVVIERLGHRDGFYD